MNHFEANFMICLIQNLAIQKVPTMKKTKIYKTIDPKVDFVGRICIEFQAQPATSKLFCHLVRAGNLHLLEDAYQINCFVRLQVLPNRFLERAAASIHANEVPQDDQYTKCSMIHRANVSPELHQASIPCEIISTDWYAEL